MPKGHFHFSGFKEPAGSPFSLYQWLVWVGSSNITVIGYVFILTFVCFSGSLDCYFLADDFMHINYLKQVFAGHFDLLLKNFWSNWLQTQGTSFYRPFVSLTMAFDYLIWGSWAWGFHLSNLLYYAGCASGLYLCARQIDKKRFDGAFPMIAGLFFVLFPLHTEVASWVIARVDSLCACFYFFSFYFFLKKENSDAQRTGSKESRTDKISHVCSILFFILSLLCKEMAVVLPMTLVLYLCCFQTDKKNNLISRLKEISKKTSIYWIVLLVYLIVRTLSLGSVLGGYQGSLGINSFSELAEKFWFKGGWEFFFYPYNREIFLSSNKITNLTGILYLSSLGYFTVLSIMFANTLKRTGKLLLFCVGWFVLAILPALSVWNLNQSLAGARFAFLASAPFCLLLSALIASPLDLLYRKTKIWNKLSFKIRTFASFGGALLFLLFFSTFFYAARKNNYAWVEASDEVQSLRTAIADEGKKLGPEKNIALLNIPNRYAGAHMLYNGSMLYILLNSPLTDSSLNLSERVHTFESALFGPGDLINFARLKQMLEQPEKFRIFWWNREEKKLQPFHLKNKPNEDKIIQTNLELIPGKFAGSPVLDINPGEYNFAEVVAEKAYAQTQLALCWNQPDKPDFDLDNSILVNYNPDSHSFIFPLTERKSWLLSKVVHRLFFILPGKKEPIVLKELRLVKGNNLIPKFVFKPGHEGYRGPDGIEYFNTQPTFLEFNYDVENIKGAKGVLLEISKPNTWFEHYSKSFRDSKPSPQAQTSKLIQSLKGDTKIESKLLKKAGYYEVRIAAIDENNKIVGYFSDPFVFQITKNE